MNLRHGRQARRALLVLAAALGGASAAAQEGYPLDGTWRARLGEPEQRQVVLVMKWDGENINGTLSPGPSSRLFESASLDPETWTVRIEAESAEGEPITIEGVLENIGSYNRTITGTWSEGGEAQSFVMTRQ